MRHEEERAQMPGRIWSSLVMPVPRGAYANVLCETVLMHLAPGEVPAASRALMALLRPGGVLYVSWRVTRSASAWLRYEPACRT